MYEIEKEKLTILLYLTIYQKILVDYYEED